MSRASSRNAAIDIVKIGARLPSTQSSVALNVNVNRNDSSDLGRSFGARTGQPYDFSVDGAK
ncbi:hypothetical protein [Rhizobium sp. F40D2]|uniref:hypothetical protein n=1 Tax=Rhizobium sp. F40D2 TaxID=3453141 RepID=UPI003F21ACB0